jgi:hypothetical protein
MTASFGKYSSVMTRASERSSDTGKNWKGGIFSRKLTTDSVTTVLGEE